MSAPAKSLAGNEDDANTLVKIGAVSRRQRVQGLVDGYAAQDIDAIMSQFAEEAVYCDILGDGPRGDEYRGKAAIRRAVARQFDMTGPHTYVDAKITIDAGFAFASWTLVLGESSDLDAPRFEGAAGVALWVSLYLLWLALLFAGMFGAGHGLPIAGGGITPRPAIQFLVSALLLAGITGTTAATAVLAYWMSQSL